MKGQRNMLKRTISSILCLAMVFSFGFTSLAYATVDEDEEITPIISEMPESGEITPSESNEVSSTITDDPPEESQEEPLDPVEDLLEDPVELAESTQEYEIYPQVHSINLGEYEMALGEINLVLGSELDEYTESKAKAVLEKHFLEYEISDEAAEDKLNLLVGVSGDGGAADTYLNDRYNPAKSTDNTDGYVVYISAEDNTIAILGSLTDGASDGSFYGLATLDQILEQAALQSADGTAVRDLLIEDYADIAFRGIVEGFYGQYTHAERLDLMEFCGNYKMNNYIYGAKNDSYHMGGNWGALYPETELAQLKELVDKGKETKMQLVWTVHLAGRINMENSEKYEDTLDEGIAKVIAKFNQLYSIGVRQFGVFFDDGYTPGNNEQMAYFINKVDDHIKTLPDTRPLIYCPENYCRDRYGDKLNAIRSFNEGVQPMWTGDGVHSDVSQPVIDYITGITKRDSYIWWNWPVNDLGMIDYMHLGPAKFLENGTTGISGLVSNPMLQAQASKFGLFSVADFGWNSVDFDYTQAWHDSFDAVIANDAGTADAFRTFAKHCSANYAMFNIDESDNILDELLALENKLAADLDFSTEVTALKSEFNKILQATSKIKGYSNTKLVNEISTWVNSLEKIADLCNEVVDGAVQYKDITAANYADATEFAAEKRAELKNVSRGKFAGRHELIPFIGTVLDIIDAKVAVFRGTTPAPRYFSNIHANFSQMLNGGSASVNKRSEAGDYIGVDFGEQKNITDIMLTMDKARYYGKGYFEYSDDGASWTRIPGVYEGPEIAVEDLDLKARFVRFTATETAPDSRDRDAAVIISYFGSESANPNPLVSLGKPVTAVGDSDGHVPENMVDGDFNSRWASPADYYGGVTPEEAHAAWIYVDLGEVYELDKIEIAFEKFPCEYKVLVSNTADDDDWHEVGSKERDSRYSDSRGTDAFEFSSGPAVEARYVKFQGVKPWKTDSGESYGTWGYSIYEMSVYRKLGHLSDQLLVDEAKQIAGGSVVLPYGDYGDNAAIAKAAAAFLQEQVKNGVIVDVSYNTDADWFVLTLTKGDATAEIRPYFIKVEAYVTNVALGKEASALHSWGSRPPRDAVDGNYESRWASNEGGGYTPVGNWLQVDLGQTYEIHNLEIHWESAANSKAYTIHVSDDGENWGNPVFIMPKNKQEKVDKVEFDKPLETRYVRLTCTETSGYPAMSIWEFEVYGREPDPVTDENILRVATFNIAAGGRCGGDAEKVKRMARATADNGVDIAGLQEVDIETNRVNKNNVMKIFAEEGGYPSYFFQRSIDLPGGEYGNATVSKYELKNQSGGALISTGVEGRSYQRAEVEFDGKTVVFYNTHLSFESLGLRTQQIQYIKNMMLEDLGNGYEYIVLTGDFNVDQTLDEWIQFQDVFNIANGGDGDWYQTMDVPDGTGKQIFYIDNIITTRNIRVSNITVVKENDSDHDMLYADLEFLDETEISTQYMNAAIDLALERLDDSGVKYTAASRKALEDLIAECEELNKENSAQAELDAAAEAVLAQIEKLEIETVTERNVALGKTVTSDGSLESPGFVPANVVDGNLGTVWQPGQENDEAWLEIDLGKEYKIDEIVIDFERSSPAYDVLVKSADGEWKNVHTVTNGPNGSAGQGEVVITLDPAETVQYVRYLQHERYTSGGKQYGSKIRQIYVYQAEDAPPRPESINLDPANIALGKTATAYRSPIAYWGPDKLTDGIVNRNAAKGDQSRWSSEAGAPGWVMIDLEQPQTFNKLTLEWEQKVMEDYHIELSDDGENWQTVYTAPKNTEGYPQTDQVELDEAVTGRYVKLVMDKMKSGAYPSLSLYEVMIWAPNVSDINKALGKDAFASSENDAYTADKATDGDEDTYWKAAGGEDEWLCVDLGATMGINRIGLKWPEDTKVNYRIEVSNNKTDWETIFVRGSRDYEQDEMFELVAAEAIRYVRIAADEIVQGEFALCEFEVYQDLDYVDLLTSIKDQMEAPTISEDGTRLVLQDVPEGISLAYGGTDYEQVIDADRKIKKPLVDTEVGVELKLGLELKPKDYIIYEYFLTVPGTYDSADSVNEKPTVLPELQQWFGHEGDFTITKSSKIVVDPALGQEYLEVAEIFAEDYEDITGNAISVVSGNAPAAGDFHFTVSANNLDEETYDMIIGDFVTVEANHTTGAYWSTRTILQILKQNGETIPKGLVRDYPKFEVRGFMFDVGRLPVPLEFIQSLIKQMSWYKMNDLNLHLSETSFDDTYPGFRLESIQKEGYQGPGASQPNAADLTNTDVFYTKDEFRQLQIDSRLMGVNIVPEFDTPGHSTPFTKTRPWLTRLTPPNANGERTEQKSYLDVLNPEALEFIKEVFDEYMEQDNPVFLEDAVVHIGTDEYKQGGIDVYGEDGKLDQAATNALRKDYREAFRYYQDELLRHILDSGRTPRVWGSQSENSGETEIVVDGVQMYMWYTGYASPREMYNKGYDMININDGSVYIVPGAGYYYDYLNKNTILNSWSPQQMQGLNLPAGDPQVLGGSYALWNDKTGLQDNGTTDVELFDRIFDILPTFSERLWSNCNDYKVADIDALAKIVKYAPNTNPTFEVESVDETVLEYHFEKDAETVDSSGNDYDLKDKGTNVSYVDGMDDNGQALSLSGGESYVETPVDNMGIGSLIRLDGSRGSTLDFWVRRDADSPDDEDQILFESDIYGYSAEIKAVQKDTGKFGFSRYFRDYSFDYELPKDEWVQIRMVMQYYKTSLYVNGEFVQTLERTEAGGNKWASLITPLARIGSKTNAFKGQIDEIAVYNVAVKPPEPGEENDINYRTYSGTAGSSQPGEGPEKAFDGNSDSLWHTAYADANRDNFWITIDLGEEKLVDGLRYLPRQSGTNGMVTKYLVDVSSDNENWKEVATGTWASNADWKLAPFDPIEARYVRLTGLETIGAFMSAAEIRITAGSKSSEIPEITQQPESATVTEGQTATFTVAAEGSGTLSYQWQTFTDAEWFDITGATDAVYTTEATALADNGARYRCVVTNTEADKLPVSVESASATLTVNRNDTAIVKLGGPETVHKGGEADYLLSIGNLEDLGTMTITFEVEDKYFAGNQFSGLNGLELLGDIVWSKQKDGIWRGQATLWSPKGISSEALMELFQMTFTAKDEAGDTNLTIVGLVLTDYNSGNSRFIDYEFEGGVNSLPIRIGIRYDINGDGVLDQRDLTDAQYYYGAKKGDANWAQARRADVNGDGVVDAEDFIIILMNIRF